MSEKGLEKLYTGKLDGVFGGELASWGIPRLMILEFSPKGSEESTKQLSKRIPDSHIQVHKNALEFEIEKNNLKLLHADSIKKNSTFSTESPCIF